MGNVVEFPRPEDEPRAKINKVPTARGTDGKAPKIHPASRRRRHGVKQQGDPDVGSAVERVGEGQEGRRRHGVAGILRRTGKHLPGPASQHLQYDEDQNCDEAEGGSHAGGEVNRVEDGANRGLHGAGSLGNLGCLVMEALSSGG